MAGRGPLPKSQRQRQRDQRRRDAEFRSVPRDGILRGPTIQEATGRNDWPTPVVAWWDAWRAAPQAALFEVTDWQALVVLADVRLRALNGSTAAATELRMAQAQLGSTWGDRLRMRIKIDDPPSDEAEPEPDKTAELRARMAAPGK